MRPETSDPIAVPDHSKPTPRNNRTVSVELDDRLYSLGNGNAVNRATMRKWGVKLGELSLFFRREGTEHSGLARQAA